MATAQPEARRRSQQLGAGRQSPVQGVANRFRGRLGAPCVFRRQLDSHQVRERRVAKRPAALELSGEKALGVVGGGVADRPGVRAPASRRAPVHPARRARCARRAGRPAQRSAPRHGSRGSGASRRRPARRSAPHRGSRVPCRPSACRPALRTAPVRSAAGSSTWCPRPRARRSPAGRPGAAPRLRPAGWPAAPSRRRGARRQPSRMRSRSRGRARRGRSGDRRGAPRSLWRTSETSQCGHSQACPQDPAGDERRPAAPVEEDDRLGARLADLGQRLPGRGRMRRAAPRRGPPRMSTTSTAGSVAAVGAPRQPRRGSASQLSGRGVALPATSAAPRLARPPAGDLARVVAWVALLLVGGVVLLVDHHQAQVAHRARRPPSAGPTQIARLAGGRRSHSSRRSPAASREWSSATRSPKRGANREIAWGVSPISGTRTIAPLPSLERRLRGRQVDLGLARAGDPVEQVLAAGRPVHRRRRARGAPPLRGGQRAAGVDGAPTSTTRGLRERCSRRRLTSPRASRRSSVRGRLRHPPPASATIARRSDARRPASPARDAGAPEALPSPSAARPASVAAA